MLQFLHGVNTPQYFIIIIIIIIYNLPVYLLDSRGFWWWCVTQDSWVFAICSSFDVLKKVTFRELDLFPCSVEGVGDT
jgi:hypothetical protein